MPDTDVAQYRCECTNSIAVVDAKFRAFSGCATGSTKGKEIKQVTMTTGYLALFQQSNNMVKIEFWDAGTWELVGCFSINAGDHIIVDGVTSDFAVTINGKTAQPCSSTNDCNSM